MFLVEDSFLISKYRYQFVLELKAIPILYKIILLFIFLYLLLKSKFKTFSFFILTSNFYIYFIDNITLFYNIYLSTFLLKSTSGLRYNYLFK